MALSRLEDFEASSRRSFRECDLTHFEVYAASGEKAGQVVDVLVDEVGHFQYLVVDLSEGMAGKQTLLPDGEFQVDQTTRRIYVSNLNQVQGTESIANNLTDNNKTADILDEVRSSECPL